MDATRRPTPAWIAAGAVGAIVLALHIGRYPPAGLGSASWELLGWPEPWKILSLLRSLAWLGAINLAAWSLGSWLERLPPPPRLAPLTPVLRIVFGLALMALAVLALAAAERLVPTAFLLLLAVPSLAWATAAWRRGWRPPRLRRPGRRTLLLSGAALALLAQPLLDVFGPDPGWDALTYHLAFPERYLFENGVVMTPFSHLSGYVMSTQMLYALALAVDGVALAVLIHFEMGVLLLWSLARLAGRFQPGAALLAPLIPLADPLFQQELGWAYADLPLALYATLAAAALLAWLEDPRARGALLYAGLLCGLCSSTRYLGVVVPVSFAVLLWLPPRHRRLAESWRACWQLALLTAAVLLPWLLRNAWWGGNPVLPFFQSLFYAPGEEFIDPLVLEQSTAWVRTIGMGRDPGALLALPWNLSMATVPGLYSGGFGFQVSPLYALGVLAALLQRELRRDPALRALLLLTGLYTLIWFYTLQEPRFLMPAFALAAWVGGVAFARLARPGGFGAALLAIPLAAVIYAQVLRLPSLPEQYAIALGAVPSDYYETHGPAQRAARLLRDSEPGTGVLLLFERRGFLFRGLRYVPYHGSSGSPVLLLIHRAPDLQALHCELQDMDVDHLFINRNALRARPVFLPGYSQADYAGDLRRLESLLEERAESLFRAGGVELLRLRRVPCDGGMD